MIVDELSGLKCSQFYAKKNKFIEPMLYMMHKAMQQGTPVQFIRGDNSGENKLLQKLAHGKDWKLQTKFEFTAKATPQQKLLVKQRFTFIASKARLMLIAALVPKNHATGSLKRQQ